MTGFTQMMYLVEVILSAPHAGDKPKMRDRKTTKEGAKIG